MTKRSHKSSPFQFSPTNRRGEYLVSRGDERIGWVTKNVDRFRGETYVAGWIPTTPGRSELGVLTRTAGATVPGTREDAARVLWELWQAGWR